MADKPTTAAGYRSEHVILVRATCLHVATKLGDLMEDLVVIGGLVPSLLIDQESGTESVEPHVGTMDLDIGLTAALLEGGRYREISERLRRAGFSRDENAEGNPTRQRWKIEASEKITVDFLIPPTSPGDNYGAGVEDVVEALRPLLDDEATLRAIAVLRRDFVSRNSVGPRRVAAFLTGKADDAIQADVVGLIESFVRRLGNDG